MRRILAVLLLAWLLVCGLTACNTMRGAREDMRRGGESVLNLFR